MAEGELEHPLLPALLALHAEIRAAVVAVRDEPFARSWLDRCGWDAGGRAVVSVNGFVAERLRREVGTVLSGLGVRVLERAG